jgi:hypothetical protein
MDTRNAMMSPRDESKYHINQSEKPKPRETVYTQILEVRVSP